jgi:DNA-binding SARP family transcriptional activator
MEFRILGPLEIVVDGRPIPAPAPRLRTLLAVLLLRPHRVVSVDELIDRLWTDDTQPANPAAAIHTYVRRLREIVGSDVLQTGARGYLLAAEPADLVAFRSYLAKAAADPAHKIGHLRQALDQWRGEPRDVERDARLSHGEHADSPGSRRNSRLATAPGLAGTPGSYSPRSRRNSGL